MYRFLIFLLMVLVAVVTFQIGHLVFLEERAKESQRLQEYQELLYETEVLREFMRLLNPPSVPLPPPASEPPQRAPTMGRMWVYAPGLAPALPQAYTSFKGAQLWDL